MSSACLSMRDFASYDETKFDLVFTMVRLETTKTQFVVKPFLDEVSKTKFREKVMGELVGIVPHKLDVSTLLNIVRKYADIIDEEALKREFAAALNPEIEDEIKQCKDKISNWIKRCFSRRNDSGIRSYTSLGRCDPYSGQTTCNTR